MVLLALGHGSLADHLAGDDEVEAVFLDPLFRLGDHEHLAVEAGVEVGAIAMLGVEQDLLVFLDDVDDVQLDAELFRHPQGIVALGSGAILGADGVGVALDAAGSLALQPLLGRPYFPPETGLRPTRISTSLQPYDMEVGGGHLPPGHLPARHRPRALGAAYVQPSRRPPTAATARTPTACSTTTSSRWSSSPRRLDIQELYLGSLRHLGIDPLVHDIRFVEDNWESPTLGAWGLGWEVWLNGMEVTQFTYFQQVGGLDCKPGQRRDHLRPGTHRHVPAGRGERLRPGLDPHGPMAR
jgi:hypothetical protein